MGIISAAALALLAAPALALAPTSAPSAPPPPVRIIQLAGDALPQPIMVSSVTDTKKFDMLIAEVDWLPSRPGVTKSPPKDKLGTKVTLILSVNGTPKEQYDLYPLANGGPRAFRPAAQPDKRKVTEGWFYGRLSMANALRTIGVPLGTPGPYDFGGGAGGGAPVPAQDGADIPKMVQDWQRSVAATGGLVVILAIGIFFIAFQIRRKV